ncbi:MAG: Rpn family recombination-promoting nuclease/putative transposase [Puniceicoccaceae bacterium]
MEDAPLNNPHDAFIKSGLGDPRRMSVFLKAYLPSELTEGIDWLSLQPENTNFLDEQLHHRHADLLFSVRLLQKPIFVHLLFEHQRFPDPWMPLRLLQYQLRIWEHFRQRYPKAKRLPPVLPIVFFQNRGKWTQSLHFRDLVDLPAELHPAWREYLPDFQHAVINLSGLSLQPIQHDLTVRVIVKVLRAILEPDPKEAFETGLRALIDLANAPDQDTFMRTCLTYLTKAGKTLDRKTLYTIIS